MPLSPQRRRPALTPVNLNLANADQTLTEVDIRLTGVDARLTKVDKGCQKLTPSTPAPTPNPSKTQQNHNRHHHPDTPSVNLRCQPHQHTPNNPEQIRTNLNKPERRQAPRPDREAARITQNTPKKKKPEHRRRPLATSHPPTITPPPSSIRCTPSANLANPHAPHYPPIPSPIHPSPLPGGRLGGGCEATSVCQPPRLHLDRLSRPTRAPSVIPAPRSVIPAPPYRHSCAGRNPHAPHYPPIPSPIHPSPLSGGRLGGGCEATSVLPTNLSYTSIASPVLPAPRSVIPAPLRHSCVPLRHSCVPLRHSCAGRNPPTPTPTHPFPNSSLPPSRGEVRWGVRGNERLPTPLPYTSIASPVIPTPPTTLPASASTTNPPPKCSTTNCCACTLTPHSCLRRNDESGGLPLLAHAEEVEQRRVAVDVCAAVDEQRLTGHQR